MSKNEKLVSDSEVNALLAEAKEKGLTDEKTVPAQAAPKETQNKPVNTEQDDSGVCDESEEKKSFGTRLKGLGEKLKANKKGVIITLAVVGAATVAVAKFAAKTVVEEVVESASEQLTDEEKNDDSNTEV